MDERDGSAPNTGRRTVLVVEDNASVREVFVRMLKYLNYDILESDGIAAAVGILNEARPVDLVVSDCMLSNGARGWDLIGHARGRRRDLPFLFITGHDAATVEAHLPRDATTRLLRKPFTLVDLDRALRAVLDGSG